MDKATEHIVQALKEAMGRPEEQPLYRSGKQGGLFAARTGAAGEAAQQALRDGLFEIVRSEAKGKTTTEWVRVTPRGVQFLYQHESPRAVLEELVAALKLSQDGLPRWAEDMRAQLQGLINRYEDLLERQQTVLQQLLQRTEEALRRISASTPSGTLDPWHLDALHYLERRRKAAAGGECSLPELFNAIRPSHPSLSLGDFHEGLARLRDRGVIDLVPFEGHLSDLAEPEFALLEGASVYYGVRRP